MPSVREIKRRIQSVKNITQVTRALEAVSASKARRAQQQAERSRPYTQSAWEILVNLAGQPGMNEHPLLQTPEDVKNIDVVLITSDRGLAGAYNMNIIRAAEDYAKMIGGQVRWIAVGRKGRDYLVRRRLNVVAEFTYLPANLSFRDVAPISELVLGEFLGGQAQQVFVAYTDFINVLTQRPAITNLLPLQPYIGMVASDYFKPEPVQTVQNREYIYEPSANAMLDLIVPRFTALQIYQAVLEAAASEHAARMVAMRNASENGLALAEDLTLEYNKARQAAITAEILDIVGGVEAMKGAGKKKPPALDLSGVTIKAQSGKNALDEADEFISTVGDALQSEQKDDLKRIEGIGPQIEAALNASGITTFAQLAALSAADLVRIVKDEHKVRMVGDGGTWAKQAQYILEGNESGLKAYQDSLVGGREV